MTGETHGRDGLVGFLRARAAERREAAAALLRHAQENDVAVRDPRLLGRHIPGWHDWPDVERLAGAALAEVDAHLEILELVEAAEHEASGGADLEARWYLLMQVAALMAKPHTGHPDYCQEWRP